MSKFLHDDKDSDNAKAIAIPRVCSENSPANEMEHSNSHLQDLESIQVRRQS